MQPDGRECSLIFHEIRELVFSFLVFRVISWIVFGGQRLNPRNHTKPHERFRDTHYSY